MKKTLINENYFSNKKQYEPQYTPNSDLKSLLKKHIVTRAPTKQSFFQKSVTLEDVNVESLCVFVLGIGSEKYVIMCVKVTFSNRERLDKDDQKVISSAYQQIFPRKVSLELKMALICIYI